MNQIALPLNWPAEEASDAFIVSASNEAAVRRVEAVGTWPVSAMVLTGPRKSGRSLFARIFAAKTGGTVIDDAQGRDETTIFHAWNDAQRLRRPLLIVADVPPPAWAIDLPDLRSRLAATPAAAFGDPDEALIGRLIVRLLERRGITTAPELIAYLTPRVERSHVAVTTLVDKLDMASLSNRRPITIPLARLVLGQSVDDATMLG